jgi:hypothetical protein
MRHKFSKRQQAVCGIIAFCAGVAYVGAVLLYLHTAWGRKEGDFPAVPSWIERSSRELILFPFGFVPALGIWALILNLLFWTTGGVLIYVLFCRRKVAV